MAYMAGFGSGSGSTTFLLGEVACSGNESALLDCPRQNQEDCNIEDAGVKCDAPSAGSGDAC